MQRSVFGLFTALLGVLCVLSAIPAFRKKRYGLSLIHISNKKIAAAQMRRIMTGSISRYLAIPEQTPAMILLFGSRLSSFFI